jgi:hypothetical protein
VKTNAINSWRKIEYNQFKTLLKEWDYEWFVSFTFPENRRLGIDLLQRLLLDWTRDLCKTEHIQVAYWYSISYLCHHPHIHLLMIGHNKDGKSLLDVKRRIWQDKWPYFARIDCVRSSSGAAKYLATHYLWFKSDWAKIDCYNTKLLKQYKRKPFTAYIASR